MNLKRLNMFSMDNKVVGWLRHVLTTISVLLFVVGCCVLGYIGWVLATSITVSRFLSGTLLFTYSVLGVGFLFFLTGLVGWMAGASEVLCILRLYLSLLILAVAMEIGGLLALNILQTRWSDKWQMKFNVEMCKVMNFGYNNNRHVYTMFGQPLKKIDDILINGWAEVNQGTRNIVQNNFNCCGFYGPKEFAYTNYPISNSCYDTIQEATSDTLANAQQLKQSGCGAPLKFWLDDNKAIWCSILAAIGGLQLMCIVLTIHIIHKLKDKAGYKQASDKRRLHDEKGAYSL